MTPANGVLDPGRWTCTVLPRPKRQLSARAFGLCGGFATGSSFAGGRSNPCWWPSGAPAMITLDGQKWLSIGRAHGRVVPGSWEKSNGSHGAVCWRLDEAAGLVATELHDPKAWARTRALGSGGGAVAGYGARKVKKGERELDRALAWAADGTMVVLPQPDGEPSLAQGTDGTWVVGRTGLTGFNQRAVMWKADGGERVVLGTAPSEAYAVRDGEQVGGVARQMHFAAALWRGTPESQVDLMPEGYGAGHAFDCAGGLQVGWLQVKPETRGGVGSMAMEATLWAGSADARLDLHALVPAPWNASSASAIEIDGGVVRVAGGVTQFAVQHELTKNESHLQVEQTAAVWECRLR